MAKAGQKQQNDRSKGSVRKAREEWNIIDLDLIVSNSCCRLLHSLPLVTLPTATTVSCDWTTGRITRQVRTTVWSFYQLPRVCCDVFRRGPPSVVGVGGIFHRMVAEVDRSLGLTSNQISVQHVAGSDLRQHLLLHGLGSLCCSGYLTIVTESPTC